MAQTRRIVFAALAAFLLIAPASVEARPITLAWNPNPEPDVTGYMLVYGTTSGVYPTSVDVGNVTTFLIDLPGAQYYFAIRAYNATGATSPLSTEVAESSVIALTYPANQNSVAGASASLQLVTAGTPVSYTATNLPGGLSINAATGLISGTISAGAAAASPYLVSASVSNATGNTSSVTFTWTVTAGVNQPPVLTAPANQTSAENATVSLQLVATDPNGNALTYSATGLPPSLTVNAATGLISGTLSFTSAGTYSVTATASDGSLSNSKTFTWTVTNVNRPPTITTPPTQTSVENATDSLQLVASDLDGNPLTFSAVGLPTGLTVNAVSGLISGTVPIGAAGTYSPTVTVSDGTLTATSSFAWNVVAAGALTVDKVVFADVVNLSTATTPAFSTTTAGEILVAFVGSAGPPGTAPVTVSGAGLTWSLVKRTNTQSGTAEIWKATASGLLSNATVTSTEASGTWSQSLTVVAFIGAAGVGATGGASAATGAQSVLLTTTQAGSFVYGVGNDWDAGTARTLGANQTMAHQNMSASGDTFWVQNMNAPVPAAGSQVQLNDTAPTTDQWNFAAVEILAAGTKTTPTITWAAPANLTFGAALSGTQLNATASVPGTFAYTPPAGTVLPVGAAQSLSVTFTPTDTVNFTTATASVAITVVRATPTITWAAPASITFGTALGATQLNATASVPGAFVYTPASGTVLPVGAAQSLSVTFTPTNTTNYTNATASVAITVVRATPTITWAAPASITFGTALGATQLNATASVPGAFVYTPASGTVLPVGAAQSLSVTFTPTNTTNYTNATASVAITVVRATPTITWAAPASITFGTALGATQLNATASVPGAFVYTPPSGTMLPVGAAQSLSVTFTPTNTTNYTNATASVAITVVRATPTITWAAPASITFGTALGATQLNATASVPGTFVYTPPAGTVLPVGVAQSLSVTFTPTNTVNYTVATRSVSITVTAAVCTFTLSPPTGGASAKTTAGSVNVTASASTCGWTATSNVQWITITSGTPGMGNGVVNYSVSANGKSTARTGTITIASLPYTVSQVGLVFTDDPIIARTTVIMAVHVTELRDRIDAIRVARGLLPYAWSDTLAAGVTWIRAQHIVELRAALAQAYAATPPVSPPTYTDSVLGSGATVKAAHIAEIRSAIIAIE